MRLLSMFLILLSFSASAGVNILANATVTNSASYAQRISSDSLISLFGNGFLSIHRIEVRFPGLPLSTKVECQILNKTGQQINCYLPPVKLGRTLTADIYAFHFSGAQVGTMRVTLDMASPGIFTANQMGFSYLAGQYVLVTRPSDAQEIINVASWDASTATMQPFPLGARYLANRHPYLVMYGTGFAKAGEAHNCALGGNVTVSIGGKSLPIIYVGPTGGQAVLGVQQINVDLSSLPTVSTQTELPVVATVTDCAGKVVTSNTTSVMLAP